MAADSPASEASVVYHAPPQCGIPLVSALVAAAFGGGIFVAFAVFQVQPVEPELKEKLHQLVAAEIPPPPVKQPPPPKKKAPVEETLEVQMKTELQVSVPPLELNQLNVKLVPDLNTKLAGDFDLNFQAVGQPGVTDFEVFDLNQVDKPPRPLFVPRPNYPVSLKKAGISGRVLVKFVVDSEGNPVDLSILESTHRGFNSAALSAISRSRFESASRRGRPVAVWTGYPIRFEAPTK
tara:strand:+ start:1818 stop:2525 length:708 start_codon:yes stop_codon:yes gene_type:complete